MVGMSGAACVRLAVVTASARSLPLLTNGIEDGVESNMNCTCPETTSVSAGVLPLYGTCCILTPTSALNCSPARCDEDPVLEDAKFILAGFALAYAMKSLTVFACSAGETSISSGTLASIVTCEKSFNCVVRHLRNETRQDHMDRRVHEQCIAVGGRAGDELGADHAARSGAVVDDDLLSKLLGKPGRRDAHNDIRRTTRGIRYNHAYRFGRVV